MIAIGEALRHERLRRHLDLEQISRELKISCRFLEAIESDEFKHLPGGVFARSFVRQYARLLGLDEEEMAAEVQRLLEPEPEPPAQSPPLPVVATSYLRLPRMRSWEAVGDGTRFGWSRLSAFALVVVVMLVCSGVYAWWQARRSPAFSVEEPVAQSGPVAVPATVPAEAVTRPPAPAPASGPATPRPQSAQPGPVNSADRRAPDLTSPAVGNAETGTISSANVQQNGSAPADPNAPVQVQLTAEEPVWVRARSDGKYLFSGTLDANQTRRVDASGVVELLLGNAGGVNILLNGRPVGSIGPKGQVRTIQLSSGGFKIVPPRASPVPLDPL